MEEERSICYSHKTVKGKKVKTYQWEKITVEGKTSNIQTDFHIPDLPKITKPIDAFRLFLPKQLTRYVLNISNECGKIIYPSFTSITDEEFDNYLGFSIMNGELNDTDTSFEIMFGQFGSPFYKAVMKEWRYYQIKRVLRFDDHAPSRLKKIISTPIQQPSMFNTQIKQQIISKETKNSFKRTSSFYTENEKTSQRVELKPRRQMEIEKCDENEDAIECYTIEKNDDESDFNDPDDLNELHNEDMIDTGNTESSSTMGPENQQSSVVFDEIQDEFEEEIPTRKKKLKNIELNDNDLMMLEKEKEILKVDKTNYYKIQRVAEMFNENLLQIFQKNNSGNIVVDEQLCGFRGNCYFRQYMKNKPAKYGIKNWLLVDNETGMILKVDVYLGESSSETNIQETVIKMIENFEFPSKQSILFVDNLFSSVSLAMDIAEKGLDIVCTCRKNRTFIPDDMKLKGNHKQYLVMELSKEFDDEEHCSIPKRPCYMLCYYDKQSKPVIMMSTKKEFMNFNKIKHCFFVQEIYNMGMGGVDCCDMVIRDHSSRRASNRWPFVLFMNYVDIAVINAYNLMKEKYKNRTEFVFELVQQLCHDFNYMRAQKQTSLAPILYELNILKEEEYYNLLKIPQNVFFFPPFSFDKITINEYISPSIEKTDSSIASLKYESSYSYCHVCKRIHISTKDGTRTKNCCFCCARNSCPKHSALICIDCLNCFIYWNKNFQ